MTLMPKSVTIQWTPDGLLITPVTPVTPSTGIKAARSADLLAMTGSNLFPVLAVDDDPWGAWPADYTPATVIAALNLLTNGSGVMPVCRVYFYADREALMAAWLPQLAAVGVRFTIAIGSGGSVADVPGILRLAVNPANGIIQIEGVNEPNGQSPVAVADTVAAQRALWAGKPPGVRVAGPSIVIGTPFPEGWITGYASGGDMAALLAAMDVANGHFYPPSLCDLDDGSGRGGAFDDVVQGFAKAFPSKPLVLPEWQTTLFDKATPNSDPVLDAYYLPIWLMSAYRLGIRSAQYFPLFDFGTAYVCGLFPKDATNPRPAAWVIRALHTLMGDHGATRFTFTPGSLDYTLSGGAPPINAASPHTGTQSALFQASDGRFFIPVWNAQVAPSGAALPTTLKFGTAPHQITEYAITGDAGSTTPLQTIQNVTSVTTAMGAAFHLFVVTP